MLVIGSGSSGKRWKPVGNGPFERIRLATFCITWNQNDPSCKRDPDIFGTRYKGSSLHCWMVGFPVRGEILHRSLIFFLLLITWFFWLYGVDGDLLSCDWCLVRLPSLYSLNRFVGGAKSSSGHEEQSKSSVTKQSWLCEAKHGRIISPKDCAKQIRQLVADASFYLL